MGTRHASHSSRITREITIVNEMGLHARPAAEFARRANSFRSEIWIIKKGKRFSATSLIEILRADLDRGATAILEAKGPDAEEAVARLARLVEEFRD